MVSVDVKHHVYLLTYFVKYCAEAAEASDTYCVIEVLSKCYHLTVSRCVFLFQACVPSLQFGSGLGISACMKEKNT